MYIEIFIYAKRTMTFKQPWSRWNAANCLFLYWISSKI